MRLGSLFSGAGLGDLGWLMAGMDIRWQCEIDEYCQKILELRFPETRKYRDVKKLTEEELEPVDIVAGGFPCQPFSVAGKQRGDQDDRNLWPKMFEVVKKIRPAWVVGENVSGILNIYLDNVLADLEREGYACRTFVFPAHALGASHRRERIWIVGYSGRKRQTEHEKQTAGVEQSSEEIMGDASSRTRCQKHGEQQSDVLNKSSQNVADTRQQYGERDAGGMETNKTERSASILSSESSCERFKRYWSTELDVGRVAHGTPHRVDRLKALGNGQVVAAPAFIGQLIMEFEKLNN